MSGFTIVGLGEVLWDLFPARRELGGAPANFSYISSLLGDDALVASRIGADDLGRALADKLKSLGLEATHLQLDHEHPTGTVNVGIASDGQPHFDITKCVAWDFLEWTPEFEALARRADVVCFGSLAQRAPQSRAAIQRFLGATRENAVRVFDVNLRQAYYSPELLTVSVGVSSILKLNREEMPLLLKALNAPEAEELEAAHWLRDRFALKLVCITRGESGSLLVSSSGSHEHPGYRVNVVDTVGAGDAFTATMVHHYLRDSDLATMNDAANRMGAWVASKSGATPQIDREEIQKLVPGSQKC